MQQIASGPVLEVDLISFPEDPALEYDLISFPDDLIDITDSPAHASVDLVIVSGTSATSAELLSAELLAIYESPPAGESYSSACYPFDFSFDTKLD